MTSGVHTSQNVMSMCSFLHEVGLYFSAPLLQSYRAAVFPEKDLPKGTADEMPVITITYDKETGVVEKSTDYDAVVADPEDVGRTRCHVFLSAEEFDSLQKVPCNKRLVVVKEDFDKMVSNVILGSKEGRKYVLSNDVAVEYHRQVPGANGTFICWYDASSRKVSQS